MKTSMRAAFEAAQVKRDELPATAKQVLRVMKRQDQRKAAARKARTAKQKGHTQ